MTKDEAIATQETIRKICDRDGVWLTLAHDLKPDLKMIKMEISIKVDDEKYKLKKDNIFGL